jgi:hypothetical protein
MRQPRRWRRRATVAAAAVVAGMLLVSGHESTAAPAGAAPRARAPRERTLVLAPGSGFTIQAYATDATRQQLSVTDARAGDDDEDAHAEVAVYEPGRFEIGSLPPSRLLLVGGHSAWYGAGPVPTLAWRDASGSWVRVTGPRDRAALVRLARSVRLQQPEPVVAPVGLTWLPTGLALASAQIGDGTFTATFTSRRRRAYELRLTAYAVASNDWTNGTIGLGAPNHRVDGHDGWYSTGPEGGQLLIEAGRCGIRVQISDPAPVPLNVLDRMLGTARIGSCDGFADWPPILS